jgi:hypothetical protein
LTCQWRNCGHVEEFDISAFIRHVQFHGFHTKLKYLGMKTSEHNHPNIPACQKSSENRNIIPDLPVEFRCLWGDCQVISLFTKHTYTISFSFSLLIVMRNFFMNMLINMRVQMYVFGEVKTNKFLDFRSLELIFFKGCTHRPDKPARIREHIRRHTQEKTIACPHCGSLFSCGVKFIEHCQLSTEGIEHFFFKLNFFKLYYYSFTKLPM